MNNPASKHPAYSERDPRQVADELDKFQIVDVREPDEFDGPLGHIEGSLLIPLATLPSRFDALDRDKPVLVVCRSGMRSANACRFLASHGFNDLTNLHGGMIAWRAEEDKGKG